MSEFDLMLLSLKLKIELIFTVIGIIVLIIAIIVLISRIAKN